MYAGTTITKPEDLEGFKPPDPTAPERVQPYEEALKESRWEITVVLGLHESLEIPFQMLGADKFLLSIYTNRDVASM